VGRRRGGRNRTWGRRKALPKASIITTISPLNILISTFPEVVSRAEVVCDW